MAPFIVAGVYMMLLVLLGIFGPSFGIKNEWVVFAGIPGFGVLMFFYMWSKRTKKPNPHINKELIEKLDRLEELEGSQSNRGGRSRKSPDPHSNTELIEKLERLEKLEKSPDRDKRIPD